MSNVFIRYKITNKISTAVFLDRSFVFGLFHLTPLNHLRLIRDSDKKKLRLLGANIKRLREAKQLSLRDMSYACNIDNSKISKIEKGQINITFTTILQIADALETHPSEVLNTDFN